MAASIARAFARRAARGAAVGAVGVTAVGVSQGVAMRLNFVCPNEPDGERDGLAGRELPGETLHLLFVGDSICMGVGAYTPAPVQAACAERLAKTKGAPVRWRTIAGTGADVRELKARVEEVGGAGRFDLAVVMCGVNDGKQIWKGRFPSAFRDDLAALCTTLREAAPEARLVVPRLPSLNAPSLQIWPMRPLAHALFSCFESQKEAVASALAGIDVPLPDGQLLGGASLTGLWAQDGIHPSGEGYRLMGEWLATSLAGRAILAAE